MNLESRIWEAVGLVICRCQVITRASLPTPHHRACRGKSLNHLPTSHMSHLSSSISICSLWHCHVGRYMDWWLLCIVLASDTSQAAICFIIDKVGLTDIFPKNLINSVVTYYCTCRHQVSADWLAGVTRVLTRISSYSDYQYSESIKILCK